MKKFMKKMIYALILFFFSISLIIPTKLNSGVRMKDEEKNEINVILSPSETKQIKQNLINEVDNYIKNYSPTSKLSGKELVETCLKYNFDITLALAQAQLESYFGTKGTAKRTNSVFNVGTFDDGTILYRYSHPNYSIKPYITLMKTRYLVRDKTPQDLLEPQGFVNYYGKRYASLKVYEDRVKLIYNRIMDSTKITSYQQICLSHYYKNSIVVNNYAKNISIIFSQKYKTDWNKYKREHKIIYLTQ